MHVRDFRDDWWYELLRLVVLFATLALLSYSLLYMQQSRRKADHGRQVNCVSLLINIQSNPQVLSLKHAQEIYRRDC